jgi:hypothetical protein
VVDEAAVPAVKAGARDITGQKRFEQMLRENEERAQRELAAMNGLPPTSIWAGRCGKSFRRPRASSRRCCYASLSLAEKIKTVLDGA